MIIEPETMNHEIVRPAAGELWAAIIHHPAGSRRWHVHYRDYSRETFRTRKAMLAVLAVRSETNEWNVR